MMNMVIGANLPLTGTQWSIAVRFPEAIQQNIGLVLLPLSETRQLPLPASFAHTPSSAWCDISIDDAKTYQLRINVQNLPEAVTRLHLVIYRYHALGPIQLGQQVSIELDKVFKHSLSLTDISASALIVGEFYRKANHWKFRALAESSAYGLTALGRRIGIELDERSPYAPPAPPSNPAETWTGTAFLVAPQVLMTNAHVVDGASRIRLSSIQGKCDAEPIISDSTNDLALLRAHTPLTTTALPFRATGAGLAEAITTLGYPLANLMGSGIQVTQGVISGLFGKHNDIRLLQFTAPIQPGSSGSPLLDSTGAVLGVASSSFAHAQNMNFAVRHILAIALLEAAQIPYTLQTNAQVLSAAQIVTQAQPAIWRVECAG